MFSKYISQICLTITMIARAGPLQIYMTTNFAHLYVIFAITFLKNGRDAPSEEPLKNISGPIDRVAYTADNVCNYLK